MGGSDARPSLSEISKLPFCFQPGSDSGREREARFPARVAQRDLRWRAAFELLVRLARVEDAGLRRTVALCRGAGIRAGFRARCSHRLGEIRVHGALGGRGRIRAVQLRLFGFVFAANQRERRDACQETAFHQELPVRHDSARFTRRGVDVQHRRAVAVYSGAGMRRVTLLLLALGLVAACHEYRTDPRRSQPAGSSRSTPPTPATSAPEVWLAAETAYSANPDLAPSAGSPDGGAIVEGLRIDASGKVAADIASSSLVGGTRVPREHGGGFLFWSNRALYGAKTFSARLEPILALPSAPARASFGPGYALLHFRDGARWALSLADRKRIALPVVGLVDAAALPDGRALLLVEPDLVLASPAGKTTWRDATREARSVLGVVRGSDALWLEQAGGRALRLDASGTLTRARRDARGAPPQPPSKPARPALAEQREGNPAHARDSRRRAAGPAHRSGGGGRRFRARRPENRSHHGPKQRGADSVQRLRARPERERCARSVPQRERNVGGRRGCRGQRASHRKGVPRPSELLCRRSGHARLRRTL